jgi:hypothetical protein
VGRVTVLVVAPGQTSACRPPVTMVAADRRRNSSSAQPTAAARPAVNTASARVALLEFGFVTASLAVQRSSNR